MSKLNFSPEFIFKILSGEKTQTRRLVKEGEYEDCFDDDLIFIAKGNLNKYKIKWQVGKKYAVCVKGEPIWYCPKCPYVMKPDLMFKVHQVTCYCGELTKPLIIELTEIRKEKLLDITEEDAKKEGFKSKDHFIDGFILIYKGKKVFDNLTKIFGHIVNYWNPWVWVIEYKVIK